MSDAKNVHGNEPYPVGLEVVRFGPCRFIGKSVYARAGQSDEICGAAIGLNWVFQALDDMNEYATEEPFDAALVTWDKYDDKNQLMGYTVGRFMKEGAPVPEHMDYIDIPEGMVAKRFVRGGNALQTLRDEIARQGKYLAATWIWSAEIFPERVKGMNGEPGPRMEGSYAACVEKTQES